MTIGIDFDGVINTNNATAMAVLENVIAHKLGYRVYRPHAPNSQDRYGFTDADYDRYLILRHNQINSQQFFADMCMMAGADNAIKTLKDMGHQTYLVTVRGCDSSGELDTKVRHYVHQTLLKWGLLGRGLLIDEQYSFSDPAKKPHDKVTQCKNLGVTVLVDDGAKHIQQMRQANMSAIHFGGEVPNWQAVITQIRALPSTPNVPRDKIVRLRQFRLISTQDQYLSLLIQNKC